MLPALLISSLLLVATTSAASSPEDAARQLSQQVMDRITSVQRSEQGQAIQRRSLELSQDIISQHQLDRPLNGIADPTMAAAWEAVREQLGLGEQDHFYIFVSFSMPESLLRAYALDAARAGGVLVFRGIEEGSDLQGFFAKRLSRLVRPGAFVAPVQIDPRLFDTYGIDRVPTMVLAREPAEGLCTTSVERVAHVEGQAITYPACPARGEGAWKIAGSITALFALEQFAEQGASEAAPFIAALRSGGAGGEAEQVELNEEQWGELTDALIARHASVLPNLPKTHITND